MKLFTFSTLPKILATFLISLYIQPIMPNQQEIGDYDIVNFFSDEFVWNDEQEALYQYMINRNSVTPEDVLGVIIGIGFQNILKKNLYIKTHPSHVRPLHDIPTLNPLKNDPLSCYSFDSNFFYHESLKKIITGNDTTIDSYLAITNPDFLEELDKIDDNLNEQYNLPKFNIPVILPLFAHIKLEERRLGSMFTLQKNSNSWNISFQIPLYYIEHNFFLTKAEQSAIEKNPIFESFDNLNNGCSSNSVKQFMKQYLVNDMFGIGDLFIKLNYNLIENPHHMLTAGLECTMPTGKDFVNGIIGSSMVKFPQQPQFNIFELMKLTTNNSQAAQDFGTALGTEALDRIARIIAATSMGEHHFGIGACCAYEYHFDDALSVHNTIRLHYLFPAHEIRFFRLTKNSSDLDFNFEDETKTNEIIQSLSDQFINILYPTAVKTKIQPGITLQYTTLAHALIRSCTIIAGYDLWYRGREEIERTQSLYNLDAYDAQMLSAYQHKFFAKISHDAIWRSQLWHIGLASDLTFSQKGIGLDWTVGLTIGISF